MKKALVIQFARFGDLLQTKRLILSLARTSQVHLCLDHSLAALASMIYPDAVVHPIKAHGAPGTSEAESMALVLENRKEFQALADEKFDEVYNLNYSGMNFAVSALFDPDSVRGHRMAQGQPLRDLWTDLAFRWVRNRRESPVNLMDFWALLADDPIPGGEVNPIARPGGGGIGVVLAGRESRRSLPADVLAACINAAVAGMKRGVGFHDCITLFGTDAERGAAKDLLAALPQNLAAITRDLTGRTDWAGLIQELAPMDTVLTPDTGTMHLATHLGAPVQALFLSNAWAWETGPYGLGHRVWQAERECAPCVESQPCPYDVACLEAFKSKEFLKFLSARFDPHFPPFMMGLATNLDPLGIVYMPAFGQDPSAPARDGLRQLIREFFGAGPGMIRSNEGAERLFQDRDWMIEDRRPAGVRPRAIPARPATSATPEEA